MLCFFLFIERLQIAGRCSLIWGLVRSADFEFKTVVIAARKIGNTVVGYLPHSPPQKNKYVTLDSTLCNSILDVGNCARAHKEEEEKEERKTRRKERERDSSSCISSSSPVLPKAPPPKETNGDGITVNIFGRDQQLVSDFTFFNYWILTGKLVCITVCKV